MRKRIVPVIAALCLHLLQSGCTAGESGGNAAQSERVAQQQRWEDVAPADYTFDFQQQCFCVLEQVQPVTIEVRDGAVARVTSRESGEDLTGAEGLQWYTVTDLFRIITEAEESGVTPLVVQYDPDLGYPTHIEAGSLAADAGIVYSAANLRPLQR